MPNLSKNEMQLEREKIALEAHRIMAFTDRFKHSCSVVGGVVVIFFLTRALGAIALAQPEAISALSGLVEKMSLQSWIPWFGWGATGSAYWFQRRRNRVLVERKGALQAELEGNDPGGRQSSGLTPQGDTPRGI
jgi:hypothetical protein